MQEAQPFLLLHRPDAVQCLIAMGLLLFGLLVMRWRGLLAFDSAFIGGVQADAGLYSWLLQSNARDLFSQPWFTTSAFYPYGRSLAWSDNFILPSLVAWPFLALGAPLEVVFNSLILGSNLLNGFFTWLLAFLLCGRMLPALSAGALFMAYPFLTAHLGHPQLQFAFFLPLAAITTFAFFSERSIRTALTIGLTVSAAFLCAVYYAVFAVVLVLALTTGILLLRPRALSVGEIRRLLGGGMLGVLPLIPFLVPYLDVLATFGKREMYEAYAFAASGLSYLSAPEHHWLYRFGAHWSHPEAQLFPGFVALACLVLTFRRATEARDLRRLRRVLVLAVLLSLLASGVAASPVGADLIWPRYLAAFAGWSALIAMGMCWYKLGALERLHGFSIITNRGLIAMFLLLALVAYLISLGPLGNPAKGQFAPGVFSAFYYLVPGVSAARAIGRIGVLVALALAVLTALALNRLLSRQTLSPKIAAALPLVILIESLVPTYPIESAQPRSSVFEYLEQLPRSDEALVVLPLAATLNSDGWIVSWSEFARLNVEYLHWSFPSQRKVVNGYSGQRTHLMREFPRRLRNFPDQRSLKALREIAGLRYVIFVSRALPHFDAFEFQKRIEESAAHLHFLTSDPQGNYLFELVGSYPIGDGLALMAPSHPEGYLHLELQPTYEQGATVEVQLFRQTNPEVPYQTFEMPADGQPVIASVSLPNDGDRVAPHRFLLKVRGSGQVALKRSRFEVAE